MSFLFQGGDGIFIDSFKEFVADGVLDVVEFNELVEGDVEGMEVPVDLMLGNPLTLVGIYRGHWIYPWDLVGGLELCVGLDDGHAQATTGGVQ